MMRTRATVVLAAGLAADLFAAERVRNEGRREGDTI
jgi:hypothetical protein